MSGHKGGHEVVMSGHESGHEVAIKWLWWSLDQEKPPLVGYNA